MAKGSGIIVTAEPKGVFTEGIIEGTPKPGTMMMKKTATNPVGGRHTFVVVNRTNDGDRGTVYILLPDEESGMLATGTYTSGQRGKLYVPLPGEEMNVLFSPAGTGDDLAIGDQLMVDDGTGKFIVSDSDPQSQPFEVNETVTDPSADQLVWVTATGN